MKISTSINIRHTKVKEQIGVEGFFDLKNSYAKIFLFVFRNLPQVIILVKRDGYRNASNNSTSNNISCMMAIVLNYLIQMFGSKYIV